MQIRITISSFFKKKKIYHGQYLVLMCKHIILEHSYLHNILQDIFTFVIANLHCNYLTEAHGTPGFHEKTKAMEH